MVKPCVGGLWFQELKNEAISRCLSDGSSVKEGKGSIINIASIYGIVAPDMKIYEGTNMGSIIDYVHLFVCAPPRYSPRRLADILKSISSRKMMEEFPKLKRHLWLGKLWARGYYVGTSGDKVTVSLGYNNTAHFF